VQILHSTSVCLQLLCNRRWACRTWALVRGLLQNLLLQLPTIHQTDPQSQLANQLPAPTEPMCPRMHYTGGVTCTCVCCADIFRLLTACLYYDLAELVWCTYSTLALRLSGRHALGRFVLNVALPAQGCGVEYAMYNNYPPPSVNRVNRVPV